MLMKTTRKAIEDRATAEAVEYEELATGRRHLVALLPDLRGNVHWCSRKFIATRNAYSGSWLQIDITTMRPVQN